MMELESERAQAVHTLSADFLLYKAVPGACVTTQVYTAI